ncbi:tyrosine-type recombinase/integrase [Candidatus Dojkabacteria bacterium]|nr:tyrosine-type recombinase/integrase [Candidatus Dojkabacteria bacterium]
MGDITLRKALDDYKTVYMPYRNFAERTRVEYLNDLEDFITFLEKSEIRHTKVVGLPIIERYVANLEQRGFASLTRKRKVVVIRSFLLFLYQDAYMDTNIAKKVVLPFSESTIPHVLTQKECDKLQNACAESPRDMAIIEVLLQTGIKLSELVRLTKNDIELLETTETGEKCNGFVRILGGRGEKDRIISVNTKACLALKNYLDTRRDAGSDSIFLNRFGGPLGERGVQKMLRKHLKKAMIGKVSINTLRHTFGAYHIAKGTNLKTIQEVMGLRDPRSTSIYISLAKGS